MNVEQYDQLIRAAYDGVLSDERWHQLLRDVCTLTHSEQGALLMWDESANAIQVADAIGVSPKMIEDYDAYYVSIDPGKPLADKIEIGTWYLDTRDLGLEKIHSHEFYQDFLYHYGLQSIMSAPLMRIGNMHGVLSLQASTDRSLYGQEDIDLLMPIMPHLVQAASLRWRFQNLSQLVRLGEHLLNRWYSPVLIIDARGKILFANSVAQDWLSHDKRSPSVQCDPMRVSTCLVQVATQILGAHPVPVATLRVDPVGDDATPTYLIGLPLCEGHPVAQGWSYPVGMVVIHSPLTHHAPWTEMLRRLFSLTAAECRLVEMLAKHHSLVGAADALHISVSTARTQLKSIFRKTGCGNQCALIQLITELSQFR